MTVLSIYVNGSHLSYVQKLKSKYKLISKAEIHMVKYCEISTFTKLWWSQ